MGKSTTAENTKESRVDTRVEDCPILELKILFASDTPSLLGKNVSGSTIDVSRSGLGLQLDCDVPVGSTFDVRITLRNNPTKYFLSGRVQWCKPATEASVYNVGISLHERSDEETSLADWKHAIKA